MKKIYLVFLLLLSCLTASAQWGGEKGVQPKPKGTSDYGTEYAISPDGTIWYFYFHPSSTVENGKTKAVYEMCLQAISKDGKLLFGNSGKVISSYLNASYTEVGQYIYANSDNTVTLVVRDCRNSTSDELMKSYTAYRIREDGTHVWNEEGVNIDEAQTYFDDVCMNFCELSDGSTALAWTHGTADGGYAIEVQKLSKDGKCLYKLSDTRLTKDNGYYTYPYLVPSDNGSFIMVYAYSSLFYIRAMKYNADGTKAWPNETKIYAGGWGSVTALQSRMKVYPTADNGVVVTWNDDRNNDGYYSPYLAYIKSDGTSLFTNEKGKPDVRLSYEELSAYPPTIAFSKDNSAIYAIFPQFAQNAQDWQQISIQKLDRSGQLLYGESGEQIMSFANISVANGSVQLGEEGKIICFFQQFYDYHHIDNLYSIRDEQTGKAVDEDNPLVRFRDSNYYRDGLESAYSAADNTILLYWNEDEQSSAVDSKTHENIFIKMTPDGKEVGRDATGIGHVSHNTNAATPRYGITGKILSTLKKGDIFIQNGKKYIAK